MPVKFDIDVSDDTINFVRMRLGMKRGGWIYGPLGSGKSYAVREAVPDGVRLDVVPGPLLGQRFATDLARHPHLGADGRTLLEAVRREGLAAGLAEAGRRLDGTPLIVDAVEHLLVDPVSLDDPAAALAWDGARAGALDAAACLQHYERAVEGWPENALWHQRLIQTLIRLGRLLAARQAVERGDRSSSQRVTASVSASWSRCSRACPRTHHEEPETLIVLMT